MLLRAEALPVVHKTPFPSPTVLATGGSSSSAPSITSSSISPAANALLLCTFLTRDDTNVAHLTPTTSGLTLGSWYAASNFIQQVDASLRYLRITVWWNKLGATPGTGTITFPASASAFGQAFSINQLASGFHATHSAYPAPTPAVTSVIATTTLGATFAALPAHTSMIYTACGYEGLGSASIPTGFTALSGVAGGSALEFRDCFKPSNGAIYNPFTGLPNGSGDVKLCHALEIIRA